MSNGVPTGARTTLSRNNLRRIYQRAIARAGDDLSERDPHGPTTCATFPTWLEDAGIPARMVDELMGHERSRHAQVDGGSRIGARYRHTTPEMAIRAMTAIDQRLAVVLRVAEAIPRRTPQLECSGCARSRPSRGPSQSN